MEYVLHGYNVVSPRFVIEWIPLMARLTCPFCWEPSVKSVEMRD